MTDTKMKNKFVMKEQLFNELYEEIGRILPHLKRILAPKKATKEKVGSSCLRAGRPVSTEDQPNAPSTADLDVSARAVWAWIDKDANVGSRLRMLQNWQGCGGLSFVAACHHRATRCWRYHGNTTHTPEKIEVSLEEFQKGIKARHAIGDRGINIEDKPVNAKDFK